MSNHDRHARPVSPRRTRALVLAGGWEGHTPEVIADGRNGFLVPNGTPEDIIAKLRGAIADMVKTPEMAEGLTKLGIIPGGQTKEQVAQVFQSDRKSFADAVKAAGIPAP